MGTLRRASARHVPVAPDGSSSPIPLVDTAFASTPSRVRFGPGSIASPDAAAARRGARCPLRSHRILSRATCSSLHEEMRIPVAGRFPSFENPDAAPVGTLDVQLDAYYHPRSRRRCLAVVEIVVVERRAIASFAKPRDGRRSRRGADGDEPRETRASRPCARDRRGIHVGSTRAGQHPCSPRMRGIRSARTVHAALAVAAAAAFPGDVRRRHRGVTFRRARTLTSDGPPCPASSHRSRRAPTLIACGRASLPPFVRRRRRRRV